MKLVFGTETQFESVHKCYEALIARVSVDDGIQFSQNVPAWSQRPTSQSRDQLHSNVQLWRVRLLVICVVRQGCPSVTMAQSLKVGTKKEQRGIVTISAHTIPSHKLLDVRNIFTDQFQHRLILTQQPRTCRRVSLLYKKVSSAIILCTFNYRISKNTHSAAVILSLTYALSR